MTTPHTKKRGKKITWQGYSILNAYGEPWSKKVFEDVGSAERYMEVFWGVMKNPPDMSKHEVIPVTITYSPPYQPKKTK